MSSFPNLTFFASLSLYHDITQDNFLKMKNMFGQILPGQSLKAFGDIVDVADIKTPRAFIFVRRSPRGIVKP